MCFVSKKNFRAKKIHNLFIIFVKSLIIPMN
jgi:hypothetical protein